MEVSKSMGAVAPHFVAGSSSKTQDARRIAAFHRQSVMPVSALTTFQQVDFAEKQNAVLRAKQKLALAERRAYTAAELVLPAFEV
eukprot:612613-Hanusia_phi.AAC.5